ncbi:MAG: GAF domain-containing protein [Methanosarcina sp.]
MFDTQDFRQNDSVMKCASEWLSEFAREKEISRGAFFVNESRDGKNVIRLISSFASPEPDDEGIILEVGEGLPGQVAKDGRMMVITDIPGEYFITSGLGKSRPVSLIVFPVKTGEKILGVVELASFHKFSESDMSYFSDVSHSIAVNIESLITHQKRDVQ